MKIIVLGGGGFIGSHVADALSKKGHKVTIFDKKKSEFIELLNERGQIFKHKSNIDIYDGILQLINEIKNERNLR